MSGFYGLIGERLGHSFSKLIHERLWADEYRLIELGTEELDGFMKRREFAGINVTIPYKKEVMRYCDTLDERARAVGCVNTVVKDDSGALHGYNTDFDGLKYLAGSIGVSFEGKKTVIFGTGGTSLTAAAVARSEGSSQVVRISRTGEDNYHNLEKHRDADIVINTTPVGMYPNEGASVCDLAVFERLSGVVDAVYNPLRTALVDSACRAGVPARGGLAMLAEQAVRAAGYFCKGERTFTSDDTVRITGGLLDGLANIVLVGMAGCGKTSVGRRLSELTGRELVDTDSEIVKRAGKSIPEIFAQSGEAGFRALEGKVIREVCRVGGRIISTGGGSVLSPENRYAMRARGQVFFLRRDISLLETAGRPLSEGKSADELERMMNERLPCYLAAADAEVDNNGSVDAAAQAVLRRGIRL